MASTSHPETFDLGPLKNLPRLWCGLWQLSSNAWGSAPVPRIREAMREYVNHGFTAFDMADHYGSAELIFGQFQSSLPQGTVPRVIGATKWCVFKPLPIGPPREVVEAAVRERIARMHTQSVDLLQFHWQNYGSPDYIQALQHLNDLRREGLISAIGLCNFDAIHTDEICTTFGRGVVVSNQIPFSLIDTRALHGMTDVCARHGVKLLTYGTLCGGFLSDRWLDQPEPDLYSESTVLTPSQRKYFDIILKAWGNWALFQRLLKVLRGIADRKSEGCPPEERVSIANIATRWVLDQESVGAVLVGTRFGLTSHEHLSDNLAVYAPRMKLTKKDLQEIDEVLRFSKGSEMITSIGDCGAEYR